MKKLMLTLSAIAAGMVVYATIYEDVTTKTKLTVQLDDTVMRPKVDAGTDPATLEAPAFWFDASDTSGWTVSASGEVTNIPSKVGTRSLAAGGPVGWSGWSNGSAKPPTLVAADAVTGLPAVDFGAMGSGCAMTFDNNFLTNIGTVIMVRDTSAGGGWIFTSVLDRPDDWKRGNNGASSDLSDPRFTLAYLSASSEVPLSHELVYTAMMRQDGYPFIGTSIGWAGHWETFSFNPTNATTLAASGLGINNIACNDVAYSGGFKIAEMLVYDRILTDSEIAGVEAFLKNKWLGAIQPNTAAARVDLLYANHSAGGGLTVGVEVGPTKSFVIKDIRGGHDGKVDGNAKLVKTGAGTLKLGDFSRYDGTVEMQGGDLALAYGVDDTASFPTGIAARAVYHFDVSAAATRTDLLENGTNFVTSIRDAEGRTKPGTTTVFSLNDQGFTGGHDRRVYMTTEWTTPTGLPTLDFGAAKEWGTYYAHGMLFAPSQPYKLTTVIAFVGSQRGGGWILDSGFQRSSYLPSYASAMLTSAFANQSDALLSTNPDLRPKEGCVYIDGQKVANPLATGYPDAGWHVVAIQIPGATPSKVGEYWYRAGGGLILGEMMAWNSPLSEEEIFEASEYLARKWMGKTLFDRSGEVTPVRGDGVADVQKVTVSTASSITVAETGARIGTLTVNAPMTKKGAGTLYVEKLVNPDNHVITFEGGEIQSIVKPALDASGIARAPSLRLDMTDTNGWVFAASDDRTAVQTAPLAGTSAVSLQYLNGCGISKSPWIETNATLRTPGRPDAPVLNFGTYGDYSSDPGWTDAKGIAFSHNLESVRSAFQVMRIPTGSGAQYLGSAYNTEDWGSASYTVLNAYRYDYHRGYGPGKSSVGDPSCTNGPVLHGNNSAAAVCGGNVYTNGVKMSWPTSYQPPYEQWVLIETHALAGTHVSGLACDRNGMKRGGYCLAELILYERELTEREKVATRNYLMKKWLGKTDEELDHIPDPDPKQALHYEDLAVPADSAVTLGGDGAVSVERLAGAGLLTKTGDGTLTLGYTTNYTGTLNVAAGTLVLQNAYRGEPAFAGAEKGLRFHLDADQIAAGDLEANTDGTTGVKTWRNTLNDGWKAEAHERGYKITSAAKLSDNIPVYDAHSLNGKATVRMPQKTCFQFKNPDGEYASVTNIRTVLWVLGSQEGGGFLLGGGDLGESDGTRRYYAWHRGSVQSQSAGQHKEDPVICGSGDRATQELCEWNTNGVMNWQGLSGDWDVIRYRSLAAANARVAGASGLAFDGRIFSGENYSVRAGNQRLAELLVYTNALSNADIAAAETYLYLKWGLRHTTLAPEQAIDLWVASGATLQLNGYNLFRSAGGSGSVTGNFGATTYVADANETGLAVTGTLTIPAQPHFALANLPANTRSTITVAAAQTYSGSEQLTNATFEGVPAGWRVKAYIRDSKLVVRTGPRRGLILLTY